jgi:hypothetical protein
MKLPLAFALAFFGTLLGGASGGCNNDPFPPACTDVPDGGCPLDNGASVCSDPTCNAAYACDNGKWVLAQVCPAHPIEAGPSKDAEDELDAVGAPDVSFDAPAGSYGGPGCEDLQTPDCSVGTALACASSPDCCGCEDLWVCISGGWTLWGSCGDAGVSKNGR